MQYALVDGWPREAKSGLRGSCPTCSADMVSKCGPRIIHHWAHVHRRQCDPWWENETQWHRDWKSLFPPECREIHHVAPDGEIHRADVKTSTGIYIEIQHSSMSDAERKSREDFYQNLVWVIDGRAFRQNFDIYHILPDPKSELAQDLVWAKASRPMQGAANGLFFSISRNQDHYPGATKKTLRSGWVESLQSIKSQVEASYSGHHQYNWVRPRRTWLDARCPVYIDFGGHFLVKLEIYDESELRCIRYVSKLRFVHDAMIEMNAWKIASRFHPILS